MKLSRTFVVACILALSLSTVRAEYVEEFLIPTPNVQPIGIASTPDGVLWFTESQGNAIGKFEPTSQIFAELPLSHSGSIPTSIVNGPDGNLWFTESEEPRIGLVIPPGTLMEIDLPAGIRAGDAMVSDPR